MIGTVLERQANEDMKVESWFMPIPAFTSEFNTKSQIESNLVGSRVSIKNQIQLDGGRSMANLAISFFLRKAEAF